MSRMFFYVKYIVLTSLVYIYMNVQAKSEFIGHIYYYSSKGGTDVRIKSDITATCFFADEGDAARQIILRSFIFFLHRELTKDSGKLALRTESHV